MTREEKVNLLNELLEIEEKNDIGNLTSTDRREFQQWVEDLEQEPKTGHWIDIMVGDMPAQACDKCNTFYPLAYTGGGHKYCPNCGAKMEVEE